MRVMMTFSKDELLELIEKVISKEYFDSRDMRILNRDNILFIDPIVIDLQEIDRYGQND